MALREIEPSGTSFTGARAKHLDRSLLSKRKGEGFNRYYHQIVHLPLFNSPKSIVQEIDSIRQSYGHQFEDSEAACKLVVDKLVTHHTVNEPELKLFVKKDFCLPKYLPPKIFSGQVDYVIAKDVQDSPRPIVIEAKSNKAFSDKNSEYQILAEMLAAVDWNRRWNIEQPVYGILASADYFRFLELNPKFGNQKTSSEDLRSGLSISENLNWFSHFQIIELFFKLWFNKAKNYKTVDPNTFYVGWNRHETLKESAIFNKETKEMVGRHRGSCSMILDIGHVFLVDGRPLNKESFERKLRIDVLT